MKCIKCLQVDPPLITKPMKGLPPILAHLKDWCLCASCTNASVKDVAEKASIYYRANKGHYKKLHVGYREELKPYYVKNIIASGTKSLKAKDIPDELAEAQKNIMKINRLTKESYHGPKNNKS